MGRIGKLISIFCIWLSLGTTSNFLHAQSSVALHRQSDTEYQAIITIPTQEAATIDKDSIRLSSEQPGLHIATWQTSSNYQKHYEPTYQESRTSFSDTCTITAHLNITEKNLDQAYLHLGYYSSGQKNMVHEQLLCRFDQDQPQLQTNVETTLAIKEITSPLIAKKIAGTQTTSWSAKLSALVEKTESTGIRLLLVLLLGLLMSLTPCIYPMIPITVGVLQAQGSKSFFHNLSLALAYTTGIATTFAILGLTAAVTGQLFGSIMSNPFFIIGVVLMLAYLGGSMLGLYDMYTPRFMRSAGTTKGGSIPAAFLFGAASGTVASPCLSPGLILLLSIVAALGNKLLGFFLLFAFGVGLSLPLLIIGTFSTSLMLLPKAGMWMIEIKKLFGFLLFGMCFYFLNNVLAWPALLGLASITLLACGIFYLRSVAPYDSQTLRSIKNFGSTLFMASSLFMGFQTYQSLYHAHQENTPYSIWTTDYAYAQHQATTHNQALFIDIGAPYCSTCKAIDRTILSHPRVVDALQKCVPVKVDAAEHPDVLSKLQEKYTIKGVPTLLLVKHNGELIKQWGGEIYDLSIDEFVNELNQQTTV